MFSFTDLINQSLESWKTQPAAFLVALLVGIATGYFLSKLRHQGVLDGLRERLAHKDELLDIKDKAIEERSSQANKLAELFNEKTLGKSVEQVKAEDRESAKSENAQRTATPHKFAQRFDQINRQIAEENEARIRSVLKGRRFLHHFNPRAQSAKVITFKSDGNIGEGQNSNEYAWRIRDGKLEMLEESGHVHSRFVLLPDNSFHHTNEADTRSIRGQYIKPE